MKLTIQFKFMAVLLAPCLFSIPLSMGAQSEKSNTTAHLSNQEAKGEKVFLQRCSMCHLPNVMTPVPAANPYKSFGPSLKGILPKDADSEQESFIRLFILKGTERMPGFQYGLKPTEIDDVITYLKTF